MNSVPPQPPAPSRQLPATLLKIPGPGPSPGHSVSGLEVAQSWGNPGRQVSDASRSRKWWNWTRNWIRAGSSHFKSLQCLPPSPYSWCGHACSGHMQDLEAQTPIQEEHRCRGTWGVGVGDLSHHLVSPLLRAHPFFRPRVGRCNEEGWFLVLVLPPASWVLPPSQSLGTLL